MKHLIVYMLAMFLPAVIFCQGIGIGTNNPHPSARLEVADSARGFLPPRVVLNASNMAAPVSNPAAGLLVYNMATAGSAPNQVVPGYYFWNGSRWQQVVTTGQANGDMLYWNGGQWVVLPIGPNGSVLTVCGGLPTWGPCPSGSISLSPANNQFEGLIDGFYPASWAGGIPQFDIAAWTNGGNPQNRRSLIKFDYSSLPSGATIDSARLFLYSMPNPQAGNLIDAQFGTNNSGFVQRIVVPWTVPNQFNWINQPAITTLNQAVITQSITNSDNSVVDVTNLVRDMITNGNNGFFIRLQNEVIYNIRQWASSHHPDASKRPRLVIYYR